MASTDAICHPTQFSLARNIGLHRPPTLYDAFATPTVLSLGSLA
jgi:hypothetical protein